MRVKRQQAMIIIVLLSVAMTIFTTVLTTLSYRKTQADSYVHAEVLNTVGAVRKLNYALSFGKPIDKFFGLDDLLGGIDELSDEIRGVEIIDNEGNLIESTGDAMGEVRPDSFDSEYRMEEEGIYAFVPFDAGTIILKLDTGVIHDRTREYIGFILRLDALILLAVVLAVFVSCIIASQNGISMKQLRITSVLILVTAQFVLGGLSMRHLDTAYSDSVAQIAQTSALTVKNDINSVVEKGIPYKELTGLDSYLTNLVADIPELSNLSLGTGAAASTNQMTAFELDIKGVADETVRLFCYYDRDMIRSKRINHVIDSMILILIAVFISMESAAFLTRHMEMKGERKKGELYLPGFRLFVFVAGITFTLDVGFFSVLSAKLFGTMGLPESMSFLSGMPNTMYSVAVLIGLLACSSLIRRFGMRRILMAGVTMGIIGYLFFAVSVNLPMLILARFVYGFCDGIIINAIRLYASSQADPALHTKILVEYMAATNLGVSCGVVIGGLIADVASYTLVFLIGAALAIVCLFLVLFAEFPERQEDSEKMSFVLALKELKKPRVFLFMIGAVVPVYIATLFVAFTFPLFGNEAGFSNSIVSGCLMLNFIIIAYLTDPISDWVIKRIRPDIAMAVYMALQTASIGIFVLTGRVWAAILALVLTSLWDCFGMVVMDLALDHVEGTSTEKCTLLQMLFGKLGMVIGPVAITAWLSKGAAGATGVIVIFLAAGLVVYGLSLIIDVSKKRPDAGRMEGR
ncbi:MAG: MFS transporter [Lachnospiraceae bacterium]|nr:MFS transporter [Lachnospiraceae bacterium]